MSSNLLPVSIESGAVAIKIFTANPPDRSVLHPKLTFNPPVSKFDKVPSYIYLYVIGFGSDGKLEVRHILYHEAGDANDTAANRVAIPYKEVPSRVDAILQGNLQKNAVVTSFGQNFKNHDPHWNRVSYVAFIIDHPRWAFCDGDGQSPPPAVFLERGAGGKNHSFHDGTVVTLGSGNAARSLFYCVNHARNKRGNRLIQHEREHFKYDLYTQFFFPEDDEGQVADPVILIFDPGGNNLGPPDPPY